MEKGRAQNKKGKVCQESLELRTGEGPWEEIEILGLQQKFCGHFMGVVGISGAKILGRLRQGCGGL